jgi:hypothetical protein
MEHGRMIMAQSLSSSSHRKAILVPPLCSPARPPKANAPLGPGWTINHLPSPASICLLASVESEEATVAGSAQVVLCHAGGPPAAVRQGKLSMKQGDDELLSGVCHRLIFLIVNLEWVFSVVIVLELELRYLIHGKHHFGKDFMAESQSLGSNRCEIRGILFFPLFWTATGTIYIDRDFSSAVEFLASLKELQ